MDLQPWGGVLLGRAQVSLFLLVTPGIPSRSLFGRLTGGARGGAPRGPKYDFARMYGIIIKGMLMLKAVFKVVFELVFSVEGHASEGVF